MDELSPLFQEIEFHERYRGYDPDEVDAFVDRVARAAAVMRGRITELHERVEAAESRGSGGHAHSDAEETLTRTLVLAQRTADAAIAEAREEADRVTADAATSAQAILSAAEAEAQLTLRESQAEASAALAAAEERSGLMLAEAETDRRAMVAEAESVASRAAEAERVRLAAEVSELHEYRAFLADDIEILERHLTEERLHLTASVSAITDLLESPEAFRLSRSPELSGVELDAEMVEALGDGEPVDSAAGSATAAVMQEDVIPGAAAIENLAVADVAVGEVGDVDLGDVAVADVAVEGVGVEEVEGEEVAAEAVAVPETVAPEPDPSDQPDPTPAPVFSPTAGPESDETIDLVAAESDFGAASEPSEPPREGVVHTEIDLVDPAPAPDLGPIAEPAPDLGRTAEPESDLGRTAEPAPDPPAHNEPAFAGMAESSLAEAPPIDPAPPVLVTAADLEPSPYPNARLGFESSTFDREIEDGGPVTEAVPALSEGSLFAEPETADDPFLAQLRDAMEGEALPERDDALTAFFDQEEDDGGRSWFGRRR